MRISLSKDLDPLRAQALIEIDAECERVRGRYITLGSGQALVYEQKAREAEEYVRLYGPTGIPNSVESYPHIVEEADFNDISLYEQAVEYLTMQQIWATISPKIERKRLAAKRIVSAATTEVQINVARNIDWSGVLL